MFSPVAPPKIIELKSTYSTSQYCLSGFRAQHGWDQLIPTYSKYCNEEDIFDGNIDDPELYTLAGWEYTGGVDPAAINPEIQPFTKYLLGISTRLFGTPMIFQWLVGIGLITLTYLISKQFLSAYLALLPAGSLAFDGIFRAQLLEPYLDLTQSFLTLVYLLLVKKVRLSMIILGLLALSKSFSVGVLMYLVTLLYWLIIDRRQLITVLKHTHLAILTYLVGYGIFFLHGHGLIDFFILHLDILRLYKSYVPEYPKGEIFRIIISGQWRQWYGDYQITKVPEWSLLWPTALLASIYALLRRSTREQPAILIHILWVFCYLTLISLRLPFPRYLLPILPSMYILLVTAIRDCYYSSNGRKR